MTEQYTPTIEVDGQWVQVAIKHGMELWWDGSTPTKRLDTRPDTSHFSRFVNNRVAGKLGEVAFSQFLHDEYGIESAVDWRIYGDYDVTDHGDLEYLVGDDGAQYPPAVEFDVKKTKPWNQWLAIRSNMFDRHPDDAPYVLTRLALPRDVNVDRWESTESWSVVQDTQAFQDALQLYVEEHFPIEVELTGTAYPDEFTDEFDEGDALYDYDDGYDLGDELRCDNVGINVQDLDASIDRWNRVVADIVGDHPISYDPL